jgi:hypothetical protein
MQLRVLALLAYFLSTVPLFFEIYRSAAFNTVQRDDYATYLLYLLGQGGWVPAAPFAYRILSVAAAMPFYYVLPLYRFTRLPETDPMYLRATEALSFVSYLSMILTVIVVYRIARTQFRASPPASAMAGIFALFLSNFVSAVGVDPFAIFTISLLVLWLPKPVLFGVLILLSAGINEKVVCLFATVLLVRGIACRLNRTPFPYYRQLGAAWLSIGGYVLFRMAFRVPDPEGQTNPALFMPHLQSTLNMAWSFKGLILTGIPLFVLGSLIVLARRSDRFWLADVSGLLVMVCLALLADVRHNIGRVAMFSYPLYLPAAAVFIDTVLLGSLSRSRSYPRTMYGDEGSDMK